MVAGSYNHDHPEVAVFRCRVCMAERMEMADVPDADGLAHSVIDAWLRTTGSKRANFDYEDLLGHLRLHLWTEYRKWDPTRGVPFLAYATGMLRFRLTRWAQDNLTGRSGRPKAHVGAVSFDAALTPHDGLPDELGNIRGHDRNRDGYSLVGSVGPGEGDPAEDCSADLGGVLTRRGWSDAREERRLGIGPDA